ncbi:MAG: DUF6263 family protein [Planctomycetota bacterium]|jgi:hypothetical protein
MFRPLYVLALFTVLPHVCFGADPEYRFTPKEVLRYKYVQNETFSYKAKSGKVNEVRALEYTLELRGKDGESFGYHQVDATFRDMKHKVVSPELKYAFDSRRTYSHKAVEKEPILGVFSAIPGETFTMSMDSSGRVNSVGRFSDLIGRAAARGLFGSREAGQALAKVVAQFVSENAFRTGFGFLFVPFTEDSKDTPQWTVERRSDFGGIDEKFTITYRFASRNDKKATLSVSGKYGLWVEQQPIPKEGEIKGSAVFDVREGRLLFSKFKASIKLPNISISRAYELKFLKVLDPSDVGPESFEKPLRGMLKLIERRRVKGLVDEFGAPVFSTEKCEKVAFFICHGDVVRVVEKREGLDLMRIVTMQGREGWIPSGCTVKWE